MGAPLLQRNRARILSTRDRPAGTGADARIEGSVVTDEVRLAFLPYGRYVKRPSGLRLAAPVRPRLRGAAPVLTE